MSGEARRLLVAQAVAAQLAHSGMTPATLAERTGIPRRRLLRLLAGDIGFGVDQLEAVAAVLEVDSTGLWTGLGRGTTSP